VTERDIEQVVDRWLRRYAGRRWLATGFYNAPVEEDESGMRRDQVRLGIALRRLQHAVVRTVMVPVALPFVRWLARQPVVDRIPQPPSWLTFWNIMYVGVAAYFLLVLFMVWRQL
jgi:hypothetical protein